MALEPFSDYQAAQNAKYSSLAKNIACPNCAALPIPEQNPLYLQSSGNYSNTMPSDCFLCIVCNKQQIALGNPPS